MLTIKQIQAIKPREWRTDGGARGAGTLVFHASASGNISAYFRHTTGAGKRYDLPIGLFDESGRMGATLATLRARAGELSKLYQSGVKDLRAHFEAEERAEREAEDTARRAQEALEATRQREAMDRDRYSLQALLTAYVGHLERLGKVQSAKHALSTFRVHVFQANPEISATPAKQITKRDLTALIRLTHEKGLVRSGGILRAYLSAAYSLAANAEGDSQAPSELLGFEIESNPVQGIKALPVASGERSLSREELRAYMGHLWEDNLISRVLFLHLLTAGQRISQLLRARVADFDPTTGTLTLWDPKGRRLEPRKHLLPLAPLGAGLCGILATQAKERAAKLASVTGEFDPNPSLFLSTGGATVTHSTPGKRVAEIAKDMGGAPFDMRDLRRTVETLLAGMGINRDTRAQLLSHGLSGVQDKHYDRHAYTTEKRTALQKWETFLADLLEDRGETSNVVPLRRRRA